MLFQSFPGAISWVGGGMGMRIFQRLMLMLQLEKSTAVCNARGNIVSLAGRRDEIREIENRIADGRQVEAKGNAIKSVTV